MDNQRFDDLTRALASGVSRRRVLAGLLGAAGSALGAGAVSAAASRCRGDGHRCGDGSDCCSGFCLDYDPVTRHRNVCATCASGTTPCNNSCVPACLEGQTMGEDCTCGCAEGHVACGGGCVPACPGGVDPADDCTCPCADGTTRCGAD